MEPTSNRPSPFAPASQVPLHRNPPLAPSQELAYREKCIALKRRLMEIESNNDNLRKRLEREKRFQDKMRLNRAILLNHLKEMMDSPDTKPSRQDLENLGIGLRGSGNLAGHLGYDRSEYMDDSSAESDEEVEPEVRDRSLPMLLLSQLSLIVLPYSHRNCCQAENVPEAQRIFEILLREIPAA
jgi:hypothetical protein